MKKTAQLLYTSMLVAGLSFAASQAAFANTEQLTAEGIIKGTMDIAFNTRTQLSTDKKLAENSPKLGVTDDYSVNLTVADTTEFSGVIKRLPEVKVKLVGVSAQAGALTYDVNLAVLNPNNLSQKKNVGKWVGSVAALEGGSFDLNAGDNRLRMAVDTVGAAKGFSDNFGGKLVGKQAKGENWKDKLTAYSFERIIGKKKVKIEAKQTDPIKFDKVELAKGPSAIYPHTYVDGRMDYDYDTGNWYVNGLTFTYNLDGTGYRDVVNGSIKWIDDPKRDENGKGHYDFNLRFNEDQHSSPSSEADAFAEMSEEDAFFAVDNNIPALTGRVDYVDTMIPGSDGSPSASNITYNLNANKLTKQQVMNFFKLWMLAVGPVNDE